MEGNSNSNSIEKKEGKKAVFSWGFNKDGQLGLGHFNNTTTPIQIKSTKITEPIQISSGGLFSALLTEDGKVYTWGCNKNGRLGIGSEVENSNTPQLVSQLSKYKISQIACGNWHCAALSTNGKVLTWGCGRSGLGVGAKTDSSVPIEVTFFADKKIEKIACGHNVTAAISSDGQLYLCGGFMGKGKDGIPYVVDIGCKVKDISIGFKHMLIVSEKGVFVWGISQDGALGLGKQITEAKEPTLLKSLGNEILKVACSVSEHHVHSTALNGASYIDILTKIERGEVFTWGSGYKFKLGHGNSDNIYEPKKIEGIPKVTFIAAGGIHSAVITSDGQLLTFGCGSDGRLGHPEQEGHRYLYKEDLPRKVDTFDKNVVYQVALSYYHSCALVQI